MPVSRNHEDHCTMTAHSTERKLDWYAHPERWRSRLLTLLLRAAAVLGSIVAVPSVYISVMVQQPGIAVLDTVAVAVVLSLLYFEKAPYRVRAVAFTLVTYALGAGLLMAVGPISQVYLLGYSLLTTMLLGMGAGAASVVLSTATLLLLGGSGLAADTMMPERWSLDVVAWLVVTLNFLLINSLLTLSLGMVIAALEKALALERESHGALEYERSELLRANEALNMEVAERMRAESALGESEARFRELAENVRDVFYNYDPVSDRVL
jgi:PAS domain-containing protein